MIYSRVLAASLTMIFLAMPLIAQAEPVCKPTARIAAKNYPGAKNIVPNNNLLLPAGKSIEAEGQKVIIVGHLYDSNCKPVPNAVVEIWQADPFGKYILAGAEEQATPGPAFAGAGRTYTDGDGQFVFTTAFPAATAKEAPKINIRIAAPQMKELITQLYFGDDSHNATDATYKKLSIEARDSVTMQMGQTREGLLTGSITLVLPGASPYRSY